MKGLKDTTFGAILKVWQAGTLKTSKSLLSIQILGGPSMNEEEIRQVATKASLKASEIWASSRKTLSESIEEALKVEVTIFLESKEEK